MQDVGFDRSDIDWALRKKEQYYKKAIKYECYPSAQEINLLLFADIKSKFDRYVYPLIKEGTDVNHRNPSKHRIEEHQMLNFIKHNRKLLNAGKMKESRVEMFEKLLEMMERYKRVNQWK